MIVMLRTGLVVLAFAFLSVPLAAQPNIERFAQTDFNFDPPGARSLGVGGAFVAIADDATAVESNPAGLTILLYPEASFEFKRVQNTRKIEQSAGGGAGGRSFARATGFPSFASVVYPIGNLRLAASYARIVDSGGDLAANGSVLSGGGYLFPWYSSMDWQVSNLGVGAALKLGQAVSVGASGGISRMTMMLDHTRFIVNSNDPGFVANRATVDTKENAPYFNIGAIARLSNVSAGLTYKRRPRFKDLPLSFTDTDGVQFPDTDESFTIKLPDAFGGGVAVKTAADRLTISLAAERVKYSQLAKNVAVVVLSDDPDEPASNWRADDGTDLRAGLEWIALAGTTPFALRVGAALLAPSNTYYAGSSGAFSDLWGSTSGDRRTEVGAGLGVSFRAISVDVGGSVAKDRKQFVTSFVIRQPN